MAFLQLKNTPRYMALSTDGLQKSGIALGSTVYITDTNELKHFNGTDWVNKIDQAVIDELQKIESTIQLVGQASVDEGTSTSGTTTSLTDTTKNYEVDIWVGAIIRITIGGVVYIREITSNTSNTVNWTTATADINTDDYEIRTLIDEVSSTSIEGKLDTLINGLVEV